MRIRYGKKVNFIADQDNERTILKRELIANELVKEGLIYDNSTFSLELAEKRRKLRQGINELDWGGVTERIIIEKK